MPIRGVNRAMRDSKWIPGLSPDMWAVDAARKVLNARLGAVTHYLPLAARRPQEDVEYVHQLRVSTRRAAAAIEVFDDFLTRKSRKTGRRALRRIRRAAGEARDADVFLQFLLEELKHGPQHRFPVLDFLVGLTLERRMAAQQQLRDVEEEGFHAAEILAGVGESSDYNAPRRFGVLAATVINPLLREFDQAVANAHHDVEAMHAIRIRGKELRYAMEIFAPCFADPFREHLYPAVEQAQEILGQFNDSQVLRQRLMELPPRMELLPEEWRRRFIPGLEEMAGEAEKTAGERLSDFHQWSQRWVELRRSMPTWTPLDAASS